MLSYMKAAVCLLALIGTSWVCAESTNPADSASERVPETSMQGTTYAGGPKKLFGDKKESKSEAKSESSAACDGCTSPSCESCKAAKGTCEKCAKQGKDCDSCKSVKCDGTQKSEKCSKQQEKTGACAGCKAAKGTCEKCAKQDKDCDSCKSVKCDGTQKSEKCSKQQEKTGACAGCKAAKGTCEKCKAAAATDAKTSSGKAPSAKAGADARAAKDKEDRLRTAVTRLGNAGWREAETELTKAGKAAIPVLIDSLGDEKTLASGAYHLGGHTKSDAGRASRQRTIAEVCCELLTTIVTSQSDYKGELPAVNQAAWREWWTANSGKIKFGK